MSKPHALTPGSDDTRNEVLFELGQKIRRSFVNQYQDRELMFALSLESGRFEDCIKDIERGRVPAWRGVVESALDLGIIAPTVAAQWFGRFGFEIQGENPC